MSRDNWEKLVKVLKREDYRKLCRDDSIGSSFGSDSSESSSFSSSSRSLSFDLSSSDQQLPQDGDSQFSATTSSGNSRFDHVPNSQRMPSSSRYAARGLAYLHKNSIKHGYIRSSNVLLFEGLTAKIADIDLLNQGPDDRFLDLDPLYIHSMSYLSIGYDAPEFSIIQDYTQKCDVYSFGVVLLELLTGRKPIDIYMPHGQQSLVTWANPRLSQDKVEQCIDLKLGGGYLLEDVAKMASVAALCTQYEADLRPSMGIVSKVLQSLLNR